VPAGFFFFIIAVFASPLNAGAVDPYLDTTRLTLVQTAEALVLNDHFAEADSLYREQIRLHPHDPLGYLLRAAGLLAEMSDREENLHEPLFRSLIDSTEQLTARRLDTCDDRTAAWMHLWRGHTRAYRSLWESKFGSFMTALKLGLTVNDEYEAGLKCDSSLLDLYAGLGSYHYWKSAKAGMLSWVGIFRNERDKGIRELQRAADYSIIHRDFARSALVWIRLDRKQYDSAIVLAEELLHRFPDGKAFLWPLAQAYYAGGDYDAALDIYSRLRARFETDPGNYYNLIECDYYLTQCHNWLSRQDDAIRAASALSTYDDRVPKETRRRQSSKISYLRRIASRR